MNFEAKWNAMIRASEQINSYVTAIHSVSTQVTKIKNDLYLTGSPSVLQKIKSELGKCAIAIDNCSSKTISLKNVLIESANMYKANERKLASQLQIVTLPAWPLLKIANNIGNISDSAVESISMKIDWLGLINKLLVTSGSVTGGLAAGTIGIVSVVSALINGDNYDAAKGFVSSAKGFVAAVGARTVTDKGVIVKWLPDFKKVVEGGAGGYVDDWAKGFYDVAGKGKLSVAAKWSGVALTVVGQGVDNYEEFGGFTGQMVAETVIESATDIGLSLAAGAGIAALAAAAGVTVPVVIVTAAGAGVVWGVNTIVENTTGKDIGEWASDSAVATYNWGKDMVGNAVEAGKSAVKNVSDFANNAGKAVSTAWGDFCTIF